MKVSETINKSALANVGHANHEEMEICGQLSVVPELRIDLFYYGR